MLLVNSGFNIFSNKNLIMGKWLRTGTPKSKANDTGDANPNCDTRVEMSKCHKSTIKFKIRNNSDQTRKCNLHNV
jgi:hypothetical protein